MLFRFRALLRTVAIVVPLCTAAESSSAQTGTLGRGLDELVRLYESGSPKLLDALKHHLTSGSDEVLVNVHLNSTVTSEQALPLLAAEGFRLQAVSRIDPRVIEGYLPLWAVRSTAWEFGVEAVLAVQRPLRFAGAVQPGGGVSESRRGAGPRDRRHRHSRRRAVGQLR